MNSIYLERIRAIAPDLEIRSLQENNDGLMNTVFIVNDDVVFRFAKDTYGVRALATERRVLDLIRGHVGLQVPAPFYASEDCMAYPLLRGEPVTRAWLAGLTDDAQQAVADQLGGFLRALHQTPVSDNFPTTPAPSTQDRWQHNYERTQALVYPLLLKHQIAWVECLYAEALGDASFFNYAPCLVHADLAPYHLLHDETKLTGVIDFGTAGLGDPATDLMVQCYGEGFVRRVFSSYPAAQTHLRRARFYAQAIELEWVMLGLETKENFWFTAHIGGARDLSLKQGLKQELK
jgi:aminoglycoside 2''-phosphotransferase